MKSTRKHLIILLCLISAIILISFYFFSRKLSTERIRKIVMPHIACTLKGNYGKLLFEKCPEFKDLIESGTEIEILNPIYIKNNGFRFKEDIYLLPLRLGQYYFGEVEIGASSHEIFSSGFAFEKGTFKDHWGIRDIDRARLFLHDEFGITNIYDISAILARTTSTWRAGIDKNRDPAGPLEFTWRAVTEKGTVYFQEYINYIEVFIDQSENAADTYLRKIEFDRRFPIKSS